MEIISKKDGRLLESQAFLLRGMHMDRLTHKVTCSKLTGATSSKTPGKYREELNWLAEGQGLERRGWSSSLQGRKHRQAPMVLC